MSKSKNVFTNRNVTYKGAPDAFYEVGKTYNLDITPFGDDFIKGERIPDNRYMVYQTVSDPKNPNGTLSGYRVYPDLKAVAKDFQKNG